METKIEFIYNDNDEIEIYNTIEKLQEIIKQLENKLEEI